MKMRTLSFLSVLLLLSVANVAFSQTSATKTEANRTWPDFSRRFTAAINKKDHATLLRMMPKDFFDGGGGLTPSEWLQYLDKNERKGSWSSLRKSMAKGTMIDQKASKSGVITRITKDDHYYFEFRKDRKWYFAGVVGD